MSYDLSPARNGSKSTISNSKIRKSQQGTRGWTKLGYTDAIITVTNFANSCVTPLFRRPQDSPGALGASN